ncbi:elongation factor-like GTPase 1 isoform X1 [Chenopodium quinoa]|uniref:elongation factor-like GTPase 1 isoform X1 n=2 Tax=Chenopodium quinoa TaxID=63459 RepID=UPI000B790AC7|nr:elongation factor-like GTPase 1 isoform X1 [Chenopodium quinoa]
MELGFAQEQVRNICILAHVDHGKTTLADHLIASSAGGVLHPKQAGKMKFMDYLDEEQRRAITMKSSSIALKYNNHSINLIDSPGHMDFCSEVSTAARLSDGALVLVDAVEGVHIQTHAVLRQAWVEKLTPCLVLNKIDRLICELKLTPMEAYNRLLTIVHEVNSIVSAYKSEKYLSDVDSILTGSSSEMGVDEIHELIEDDEEEMFQPQKGNVAFVCALDGWGFTVGEFAEFYAEQFKLKTAAMKKALWGPWYCHPKTGKIVGRKGLGEGSTAQPMFVQCVLKPLWQFYQGVLEPDGDKGIIEKVMKRFKLVVPDREKNNKDPKIVLQAIMSRWLPLSEAILSMVIRCMPDPVAAQAYRVSRLLPKREVVDEVAKSEVFSEAEYVRKCVETCAASSEAPTIAFVAKMFAVPMKMIPHKGPDGDILNDFTDENGNNTESDECFLAFARIFSGTLTAGQKIYVLSALYDPLKGEATQKHLQEAELQSLYLMMGQGLTPVASATAGNVVAIRGLGHHILKSATLSSTKNCWPFSSLMFQVSPMLKVAIEPSDPADMGALMKGLRLLNRADPFVEVSVSSRGEHVLAAAGEVHLERCIKDLKERFAKVSLEVSPPLVSYKETIEGEGPNPLDNLKILSGNTDYVEKTTSNGRCTVRVQVMKLPNALTKLLNENSDTLGEIISGKLGQTYKKLESQIGSVAEDDEPLEAFRKRIRDAVENDIVSAIPENETDKIQKCKVLWDQLLERIWALGPGQVGPNLLITPDSIGKSTEDAIVVPGFSHVSEKLGFVDDTRNSDSAVEANSALYAEAASLASSVVSGFQIATSAGPLCDEPMWGLAFLVEAYISSASIQSSDPENSQQLMEQYGMFTGQVMTAVKEACRAAVLQRKPRLVEAMYFCELNTPVDYLGSMYGVLARRRARVVKEEMQESSPLFTVHAYLPVAESFGFADELRKWTSGSSSALLVLSHWEQLMEDPFFVPKTEEEIEEFGDGSSVVQNTARKLIDAVRRRKGLPVEEKVVQHATKQRTLARKV